MEGIEKDVFEAVPKSKEIWYRIFGSKFVDSVKNEGTPGAYEKSRLVVQGFHNQSPHFSQRLLFSLSTIFLS